MLPAVRDFLARSYRADYPLLANENLFRWQFGNRLEDADVRERYNLKLALVDGEVAGCLGYIPVDVMVNDARRRGAWVVNWMVEADKRRLGLGPFLMREVMKQFDIVLNVGPSHDAQELLTRMGWTHFGELTRHIAVLDAQGASALCEGGSVAQLNDVSATTVVDAARDGMNVSFVRRFQRDATHLWQQTRHDRFAAGADRAAEYLNWRYADHPEFDYRLFEARNDNRLIGCAIYRVEAVRGLPMAVRVGRIVELIAEEAAADALLQTLIADAREHGVVILDFFCAGDSFSDVMRRNGFLTNNDSTVVAEIPMRFQPLDRRRKGIPFMAYLHNMPEAALLTDVHRWYVTKGDGDQDRPN